MNISNLTITVLLLNIITTNIRASSNITIDLSGTDKQFLLASDVIPSMKSEGGVIVEDYKMTLLAIVDIANLNSSLSPDGKSTIFTGIKVNIFVYKSEEKVANDIGSLEKVKKASLRTMESFEMKSYDMVISDKVKEIRFQADNISIKDWKEESYNKVKSMSKYCLMPVHEFDIEEGRTSTIKFRNLEPELIFGDNTHAEIIKEFLKKLLSYQNNGETYRGTQQENEVSDKFIDEGIRLEIIKSTDENKNILKNIFDTCKGNKSVNVGGDDEAPTKIKENGGINKILVGGAIFGVFVIVGGVAIVSLGIYCICKSFKKV